MWRSRLLTELPLLLGVITIYFLAVMF